MMKNKKLISCILISAQLCSSLFYTATVNGTSGFRNTDGDQKQQINFYGTLITHQGQKESVDNISIGEKYKDITMYLSPTNKNEEILNPKTKQAEVKLDENPVDSFVKKIINLCNVSELRVPKPNTVWYYQKEDKTQRSEFTQVHIVFNDKSPTEFFLLEHKTHINCDSLNKKTDVPLTAIDKLIIEGYGEKKEAAPCGASKPVAQNPMPKID
jgi:hypothetical protein